MGDRAVWLTVDGPTRREGCEPPRPQTYFCLALYTFALVGLVLLAVESVLGLRADSLFAQVVHWVLTITVWLGGAIGLTAWAGHRTDFRVRGDAEPRMGIVRWFAVAALVVVTLAAQCMLQRGALSPFAEHNALSERFGDAGTVAWLVQVAYYCAELAVIVLIVGFGQRAGECWLRPTWVPWGGIMLAMTWGLVHFLTQDAATGLRHLRVSRHGNRLCFGWQKPPHHLPHPARDVHPLNTSPNSECCAHHLNSPSRCGSMSLCNARGDAPRNPPILITHNSMGQLT